MCKKELYISGVLIVMAVTLVMFIPMVGTAGSLEPSAAPAPTMKTLDQIPPAWSIKIQGADRFVVLADFNDAAVLDRETGLVWEKIQIPDMYDWYTANSHCYNRGAGVGKRMGWRLPTVEELTSLMDLSVPYPGPRLTPGHPFLGVQPGYWSATTVAGNTSNAWNVGFLDGSANSDSPKSSTSGLFTWCVRGGQSYDAY
jgi:hypothetical protein